MASFGDALRGYASVLNPQVAQEVAQERRAEQGQEQQLGMMLLQKKMQEQSPEYQARLEALNNEKQFRLAAAQAGGDPAKIAAAAAQFGKPELAVSLYNQQESRAARLQQAQQTLALREQELTQRADDKAADRVAREQAQQQLIELKKQGLALQAEIAKGNQDLKKMQFSMQADQKLVQRTQQLGTALEKANLPVADAVLTRVEDSLGTDQKKAEEIAGYMAGPNSWKPDLVVGDDVKKARQAVVQLFNITLKDRSGAAVTNQELERLKQEFSTGMWKTPKQLLNGIKEARKIIDQHYKSIASGYGTDVLKAYNENLRGLGGKVVLDSQDNDPLGLR